MEKKTKPEAPDEFILKVEEIHSGYGEIEVLRGVSFQVRRGEIVCLIGPNGAGKSTLLKSIFGLVSVWNGKLFFGGIEITRKRPEQILRLGISIVPQGRCNFPQMTVRENLEMGAYTRSDRGVQKDIEILLDKFPVLRSKQRQFAGNLSGGEQQILEMASSLLLNPQIVLLDEPSLGLSPIMVSKIFETIQQINREGKTIIMVEQNAKQALQISNHAVVLELGRKRLEGTGQEILNNEEVKRAYLGQ